LYIIVCAVRSVGKSAGGVSAPLKNKLFAIFKDVSYVHFVPSAAVPVGIRHVGVVVYLPLVKD